VTPLDMQKNRNYKRASSDNTPAPTTVLSASLNDLALKQQEARLSISPTASTKTSAITSATAERKTNKDHRGEN